MSSTRPNKYRQALEVLVRGRDVLIDNLAEDILNQEEMLAEGGFLFNDFIESQGPRLHFLYILTTQLEFSADKLDEMETSLDQDDKPRNQRSSRRRRSRNKRQTAEVEVSNVDQNASKDTSSDDV